MRTIKSSDLVRLGACRSHIEFFEKEFGLEVQVTEQLCLKYWDKFSWDWAANKFLTAPACKKYHKEIAPATEKYLKEIAPAWEKYLNEITPAWDKYEKEIVAAREEYNKEVAAAREKYDKEIAPAWEKYGKEIAQAREGSNKTKAATFARLFKEDASNDKTGD